MVSNPSDQVWLQYHRHVLATLDEPDLSLAGSLIQATETFRVMHHRSFRPTIVVRAEL